MRNRYVAIVPLALGLVFPAMAGDKKKDAEPGITREQADQILDELRQIRQLLEQGARPAEQGSGLRMDLEGVAWLGSKEAPITIVEFTDYQCTFCRRFHAETFPELKKQYIDTGKVRFTSRDMPLDFHSNAARAAEGARCAGDQGRFWEMRDRLISNADKLSPVDIDGYAKALKLDTVQFGTCMQSGKYSATVKKETAVAEALGVTGTPTFLVGKSTHEGVSGELMVGAMPIDAFAEKLKNIAP